MRLQLRQFARLIALSSGMLLASGCDVAEQVAATIRSAFRIVDVWV